MRLETQPYSKVRDYTPPAKEDEFGYAGRKMQHQGRTVLVAQKGFFKCPHCLNGVAKQSVDAKDLVWDCVMCGWSQPMREPERRINREAGSYDTKRY
jgi:ribosomal protein L37AE/L43A